jgi:hypothetical protein
MPPKKRSATLQGFDEQFDRYLATITPAVAFLQGRDPSIGHRICGRNFLPEGPRFESLDVYRRRRRRSAGLGLWLARRAGPGAPLATLYLNDVADVLREAVDSRFRVRPLRRIAGAKPAQFRAAGQGAGRAADAGRQHPAKFDQNCRRPQQTESGAAFGALPRFRLCRLPHRANDQGARPVHRHCARRRLCQYRIARAEGSAGFRLFRLRHAGRRRAAHPRLARTPRRQAATASIWSAPSPASTARSVISTTASRMCPSPKSARRPGTACRSTATCRCSTCSIPCTGCGRTGAGTS